MFSRLSKQARALSGSKHCSTNAPESWQTPISAQEHAVSDKAVYIEVRVEEDDRVQLFCFVHVEREPAQTVVVRITSIVKTVTKCRTL